MKKNAQIIFALVLFIAIFAINSFVKIICPEWADSSKEHFTGMVVITLFIFGYAFYSWKFDISKLSGRLFISLPFAMAFMAGILLLYSVKYWTVVGGLAVCILLLFNTSNWKHHFLAILTPTFLLMIVLKFFLIPLLEVSSASLVKTAIVFATIMPILSFLVQLPKSWLNSGRESLFYF